VHLLNLVMRGRRGVTYLSQGDLGMRNRESRNRESEKMRIEKMIK